MASDGYSEEPQEQQASGGRMSLFHQLFAPDTMETDVSEDSQFDSLGSASQYTDMTGSIDEDDESEANDESTGEASQTSTLIKFDRDLRSRHRAACKNMTVRESRYAWNASETTMVSICFFPNAEWKIRQGHQDI